MGAKGKRRREKNYRAAHGGYTALPPPPDASKLDALPSKLRKIISFSQQLNHGAVKGLSKDFNGKKKKDDDDDDDDDGHVQNGKGEVGTADAKQRDTSRQLKASQDTDSGDDQLLQFNANDKKKKKRKRKEVKDHRFAMEVNKTGSQLKKRERKRKYLEAKKKHTMAHEEEKLDFPGHEKIKFGDIVQAPPKLVVTPKAFKNTQGASHERLRLRAIKEYRSRKGWMSRPGSQLPLIMSDP